MGVILGKFSTVQEKSAKGEMNHKVPTTIAECNNIEKGACSGKSVRFLTNSNNEIVATPLSKNMSARPVNGFQLKKILKKSTSSGPNDFGKECPLKWNFEDEFKLYLQESTKRKLRSSDTLQLPKKAKFDGVQSTLVYHTSDQDSVRGKLKIVPINLQRCFSEDFKDRKVVLKKLPNSVIRSCIPKKADECLSLEKNSRRCIKNKVFRSCTDKYTKMQNLKWIDRQLGYEPRVVLDSSIVTNYLNAKSIINEILRAE